MTGRFAEVKECTFTIDAIDDGGKKKELKAFSFTVCCQTRRTLTI